ncbi:unnamed protein product [Leptosia nina]|uniref:Elongation of very long chain fatty acids protein n=1 Tax=Leptosia nina TaxID=320188 RepID=A0AAV1JY89_9NEOP
MESVNITQNNSQEFDFEKSLDVGNWFLMGSPVPLLTIMIAYWLFVLKVGRLWMNKRTPFTLTNVLAVYNVAQIFISLYILCIGSDFLWHNGLIQTGCGIEKADVKLSATAGTYTYFLAKITELFDTIFFILRKKYNQASFLHIYHHSITVMSTWVILKYEPNMIATIFLGTLNSFVHVIMYTYYALSAYPQLAKHLWWKKYITKLQLVQFMLIFVQILADYKYSKCKPSNILITVVCVNLLLFVYLFSNFYVKTYKLNDKKTKNVD